MLCTSPARHLASFDADSLAARSRALAREQPHQQLQQAEQARHSTGMPAYSISLAGTCVLVQRAFCLRRPEYTELRLGLISV